MTNPTIALAAAETFEITQLLGAKPFPPGTTIQQLYDAVLPHVVGLDDEKLKRICAFCLVGHYVRVRRTMAESQKSN